MPCDDRGPDTAVQSPMVEDGRSKVDRIRRQLAAGTYDVEKRLNAVVDKVLKAINA